MTSKRNIPTRRFIKPTFEFLIEKKRDGGEFSQEEIRFIIDSTLDGEMPRHQLAALAMAIYFSGMSAQETADLTEEMMLSGEVIDLSLPLDSHLSCAQPGSTAREPPRYALP